MLYVFKSTFDDVDGTYVPDGFFYRSAFGVVDGTDGFCCLIVCDMSTLFSWSTGGIFNVCRFYRRCLR